MLTRIEIDGFKTFRDFALDVPPFLVVLGRNASGKSNLFDAIQFLRGSVDGTLADAAQRVRGDTLELFHRHVDGTRRSGMSFAAEVLVLPVLEALGPVRGRSKVRDDVVFVDMVTRVDPAAPRSRISRVRWLRGDGSVDAPTVADGDSDTDAEVSPQHIVSDTEVAEFEVRDRLGG